MAEGKTRIRLNKGVQASNDCLPHAAMNLGAARGVGMHPQRGLVWEIIIEPSMGQWVVYRMDDAGGFVGDSWHGSREDAAVTVKKEFGIDVPDAGDR